MKRNLLLSVLILLSLNSLQAWNPFRSVKNLVNGERGCTTELASNLARNFDDPRIIKNLQNKMRNGDKRALIQFNNIKKQRNLAIKCIGAASNNRQQNILRAHKVAGSHPNFIKQIANNCSNNNFKRNFKGQCLIAELATNELENKGNNREGSFKPNNKIVKKRPANDNPNRKNKRRNNSRRPSNINGDDFSAQENGEGYNFTNPQHPQNCQQQAGQYQGQEAQYFDPQQYPDPYGDPYGQTYGHQPQQNWSQQYPQQGQQQWGEVPPNMWAWYPQQNHQQFNGYNYGQPYGGQQQFSSGCVAPQNSQQQPRKQPYGY